MEKQIKKVLVIQSPHYDFNASTLIEGLVTLENKNEVEFHCTETSNYGFKHLGYDNSLTEEEAIEYGKEADIIALCSNNSVKEHICDKICMPEKTVYIDGEDTSPYKKNPEDFVLYFKREMLKSIEHPDNVKPFPFGCENRYFYAEKLSNEMFNKKSFNVACMFGVHDDTKPDRRWIEQTLIDMDLKNSHIGQMFGGNAFTTIDTGNRDHEYYYKVLAHAKISVDGYGAYQCNACRFWESLANGCCLLTQPILIHMPNEFINNEDLIEFSTPEDLKEKVNFLLENPDICMKIAKKGYNKTYTYHTTEARAKNFLNECEKAGL